MQGKRENRRCMTTFKCRGCVHRVCTATDGNGPSRGWDGDAFVATALLFEPHLIGVVNASEKELVTTNLEAIAGIGEGVEVAAPPTA